MNTTELRAELSAKSLDFELAMSKGTPHQDLIKIYKELKELQYQVTMLESQQYISKDISLVLE